MKTILFLLLITACTGTFAKDKSYQSHWRNNEQILTMPPSDYTYSEKEKFYYYISNDNDNIYINLKIFSQEVQNHIVRDGLVSWINSDGKTTVKTGIRYPVPVRLRSRRVPGNNMPGQGGENAASTETSEDLFLTRIELYGFDEAGIIEFNPADTGNFRASIKMDKGNFLNYEVIIPRSKLTSVKGKKGDDQKPINIGFSYPVAGSMARGGPAPTAQDMPSGGTGGGGGGRGSGGSPRGGAGGGMPGGFGGGSGGFGPAGGAEPEVFWIKNIILATEE